MKLPTRFRFLSSDEYLLVSEIFGCSVPSRRRIILTNGEGFGGRAFTIPISLVLIFVLAILALPMGFVTFATVLLSALLSSSLNFGYLISLGKNYSNLNSDTQAVLIHEMVHVLQSEKSFFSINYVLNSCFYQVLHGRKAYEYELGKKWKEYTVEQQAQIIEDWFRKGKRQEGIVWEYIGENFKKMPSDKIHA